ncbi:MAG: M48 family metalloprotease [Nocardioides sp.]
MSPPDRRIGAWTAILGLVVFAVVAVLFVPWDPVPGGALTPTPESTVFSAEEIRRSEDFSRWARVWSWSSLAVSLAVAVWFGFSDRGRALFTRLKGPWWVQVMVAVVVVTLAGRLLTLPFAIALRQHVLDYGLSNQSWPAFALDLAKSEIVAVVVTSIAVIGVIGCARRWQRAWPAVAGALLAGLALAGSFAYPLVIEPIFNSFTPLPEGELRSEILALAEDEGVEVDDVLVADASRRTTTLNAYVSGFGSTRRVVVYDNLVESLPQDQALSVIAHELAHARHRDVLVGSVLGAAGALVGVGLLALGLGVLRRRGHPEMSRAQVVPVVLALVAVATLASAPIQNGISRQIEIRADVDALTATADPAAFVGMQRRLALRSLSDPSPPALSQWWFGSHPTTLERIALAMRSARD